MTQREEFSALRDRLAVDDLVTGYAAAVDDGDWTAYRKLFTPAGRADYRDAGGIEGPVDQVADWLAESLRHFLVRQHLIVNRLVLIEDGEGFGTERATVRADYFNPMVTKAAEGPRPDFVAGGRYAFTAVRAAGSAWRLDDVTVREKWRLF